MALFAYFWFFPGSMLRGCIHAVRPPGWQNEENSLTEEETLDLFRIDRSEYKITWKFLRND